MGHGGDGDARAARRGAGGRNANRELSPDGRRAEPPRRAHRRHSHRCCNRVEKSVASDQR